MIEPIITEFDEESGEWEIADTGDDDAILDRLISEIDETA